MADSNEAPGTNVYLVRADVANFERSVSTPVDLDAHEDRPEALSSLSEARVWGVPEGDRSTELFEAMESGDLVLFYRDGAYVAVGRVGTTVADDDGWAEETLWEGDGFSHLFTVTDFAAVDVDRAAVNAIFGYSPTYAPPDVIRVADDRVNNSLDAIELAVTRYHERAA